MRSTAALGIMIVLLIGCGGGKDAKESKEGVSGDDRHAGGDTTAADEFRESVFRFCKTHTETGKVDPPEFARFPSKEVFYKQFGRPERETLAADHVFLDYNLRDGTVRIKCNKGLFQHNRRIYPITVEREN